MEYGTDKSYKGLTAILDTGASRSIIPYSLAITLNLIIEQTDVWVELADGRRIKCIGLTNTAKIIINPIEDSYHWDNFLWTEIYGRFSKRPHQGPFMTRSKFFIIPENTEVILGADWHHDHCVSVYFPKPFKQSHFTIYLGDNLRQIGGETNTRGVTVSTDVLSHPVERITCCQGCYCIDLSKCSGNTNSRCGNFNLISRDNVPTDADGLISSFGKVKHIEILNLTNKNLYMKSGHVPNVIDIILGQIKSHLDIQGNFVGAVFKLISEQHMLNSNFLPEFNPRGAFRYPEDPYKAIADLEEKGTM